MMSKRIAIVHISDLHIADIPYVDDTPSRLQDPKYLECFIQKIKKLMEDIENKYMVITGDLTQTATKEEYNTVKEILVKICDNTDIRRENVIIVPGNHDICWEKFKQRLKEKGVTCRKEFHKYSQEKFYEFKEFYDDFFKGIKNFDPDKAIFDFVQIEGSKVCLLGVNSIFHESNLNEDHFGCINAKKLEEDLTAYKKELEDKFSFAVLHHTPIAIGDEVRSIKNWETMIPFFSKNNIKSFICGHTHVSNSSLIQTTDNISYFVTGSLGKDEEGIANTFLILEEGKDDKDNKGFVPNYYKWECESGEKGYWQILSEKESRVPFLITQENIGIDAISTIVRKIDTERDISFQTDTRLAEIDNEVDYNRDIEEFLFDVIRKNDLYVSGHFHWSKRGRSHSLVKTNYFFENYECMEKVKKCYLDLINRNHIETELVVGYAMQGSVIGSLIAIEKEWKYTYCPAVAKKYSEYEKVFPEGDYKNITVIIDLIYTDNLIKWIISKLKKKYENLKIVNVCTLLYANPGDALTEKELDVKYSLFYVHSIDISKCPYKNKDECMVYQKNLDSVHILYSEEEK